MKRLLFSLLLLAPFFASAQTNDFKWIKQQTYTATGTDTYAVTVSGVTAYTIGLEVKILFTNANTGPATLNINSLGAKTLRKNGSSALASGDLVAGATYRLTYDGTYLQVLGLGGAGGGSMVYPGAGIPLSTGSAWGTSITDNSANWNTAFGWGNHASAGYITLSGTQSLTGNKLINPATYNFEVAASTGRTGFLSNTDKFRTNQVIDALPPTLAASTSFTLTCDLDFSVDEEITWDANNVPTGGVTLYLIYLELNSGDDWLVTNYGTVSIPDNSPVVIPGLSGVSFDWVVGAGSLGRVIVVPNNTALTPYILTTNDIDLTAEVDGGPFSITQGTALTAGAKNDITTEVPSLLTPLLGVSYYYELISTGHSFSGPSLFSGNVDFQSESITGNIGNLTYRSQNDALDIFKVSEDFGFLIQSGNAGGYPKSRIESTVTGTSAGQLDIVAGQSGGSSGIINIQSYGNIELDAGYDPILSAAGNLLLTATGGGYIGLNAPTKVSGATTEGDLLTVDAAGNITPIGISTDTYVLTMIAGLPGWAAPSGGYTDEQAQDAVGAMVDGSLTYVDGTPLLQRSALSGAIIATAGSNSTSLGSFTKAQLDGAVSDGNVLYVGDAPTAHTLDSHSNVTITANSSGELLKWNGSAWINNTLAEAGIQPAGSYLTSEVDGSVSNEGSLTVTAGSGTTSVISSNTSGSTDVTITAGTGLSIAEAGNVITLANTGIITEVDGSTTNELQTITNSSDATSHTVTLSSSGGTVQLIEGANITLTTGGTGSAGTVTIASSGGGLSDGDKGDITVGGSGTTLTIDNDAVTYAKIQNVTDARLIGRSAGSSGDAQEITVGAGLTLSGGSLTASASSPKLNDLLAANGTNSIDNLNNTQTWNWNTLTANGISFLSNTTAAANGQNILYAKQEGANAASSVTSRTAHFENTHTGTGSINIAQTLNASGGSTNVALEVLGGRIDFNDGVDITFGNTTGTKIGTSTSSKIGFYNATPVVRQSAVTTPQGIADALTAYGLLPSSTVSGGSGLTYAQSKALSHKFR